MQEKLNKAFVPLATVLLVVFAFGLGRLTKIEENRQALVIENPVNPTGTPPMESGGAGGTSLNNSPKSAGKFVASRNGTKFHLPWCSGAKRITEANKIWFNSKEEALAAGYTPAANCPGL